MIEDLPELDRLERLKVDIDARLASLWLVITEPGTTLAEVMQDEQVAEAVGAAVRAAYAWGHLHGRRQKETE